MDPEAVAKQFVDFYYHTFDTNSPSLVSLYQDSSMLTFEGTKIQGAAAIAAKLTGIPFQQCHHSISTIDWASSSSPASSTHSSSRSFCEKII
ncbi:NTF2-like protein [Dioscorea alata]|uniref:NTF2-like protein n=1 Tax=Dioscorea alata TaxID=55571 RepID=A0ACB7W490_DIOAL|nr:NTF2-like protein [Dioscorea alata]